MSKQSLLTLANFNLFRNTNQEIEFSIAKDHRVQAQYSAYDKQKGFDVRGIRAKSSSGVAYIRLSISMVNGDGKREYHNGALFANKKKETEKQPDFQGSINLDNKTDGPKLRLSAWKKRGDKAGDYLSVSIQEFLSKDKAASEGPKAPVDAFDLENDPPLATKGGTAAFDDMDDDIPF
ncbi:MAG: hypothetical protein ACK5BY_13245 [Limnohabitans sp.]|jgi:hypothetical protein|uniref:hypothetical protein n=1 Tax=Limnohabitans sp. TaxID=1907725 RepID=UPI003919F5A7